jgi:hypothetical protein
MQPLLRYCVATGALVCVTASHAKGDCDVILRPTADEWMSTRSVYSYAYDHALTEYELLQRAPSDDARSASGTYVVFKAEYASSTSGTMFRDKVQARVDSEKVFASSDERSTAYKTDFTPAQVEVWSACAKTGGVLLFTESLAPGPSFTLHLRSVPAAGQQTVTLNVTNGTIDGAATKTESLVGTADRTYDVVRSPALSTAIVKVTATAPNGNDMLGVPNSWKQPVTSAIRTLAAAEPSLSRSFRGAYQVRDASYNLVTKAVAMTVNLTETWLQQSSSPDRCELRLSVDNRGFYTPAARSEVTNGEWQAGFTVHSGPVDAVTPFCSLHVEPVPASASRPVPAER